MQKSYAIRTHNTACKVDINRFISVFLNHPRKIPCDFVKGIIPANSFEMSFPTLSYTTQRIRQTVSMVNPFAY